MRFLIITALVLLTGCTTAVPIKRVFPEAPSVLMNKCPDLKQIPEETTKLSEMLATVSKNYSTYHECQYLIERWHEWYQIQKNIFEQGN